MDSAPCSGRRSSGRRTCRGSARPTTGFALRAPGPVTAPTLPRSIEYAPAVFHSIRPPPSPLAPAMTRRTPDTPAARDHRAGCAGRSPPASNRPESAGRCWHIHPRMRARFDQLRHPRVDQLRHAAIRQKAGHRHPIERRHRFPDRLSAAQVPMLRRMQVERHPHRFSGRGCGPRRRYASSDFDIVSQMKKST